LRPEFSIIPPPHNFVNRQIAQIFGSKNPEICAIFCLTSGMGGGIMCLQGKERNRLGGLLKAQVQEVGGNRKNIPRQIFLIKKK
jgi:hypothetical protein